MKFERDLREVLTPYHHLATHSGHTVAQPWMPTVCGVSALFAPPLFIRDMKFGVTLQIDGRRVIDDGNYGKNDCGLLYSGGTWQIDRITRKGTYHHRDNGQLFSLAVTSELFALRDRDGFALRVHVNNRCGRTISLKAQPQLTQARPGMLPLSQWDYSTPAAGAAVQPIAANTWSNGTVDLHLTTENLNCEIAPDQTATFFVAMTINAAGTTQQSTTSIQDWIDPTIQTWEQRLDTLKQTFPTLHSDIPGLQAYYERSLVSGLTCLWDKPSFITNPFVATSGLDGGAICCYPWDTSGYAPDALAFLLGPKMHALADAMAHWGLDKHSRFALDGSGRDVPYAYNAFSFISLIWASALHQGPDEALYEKAVNVFLQLESSLTMHGQLADYGFQHNLLEMRQSGYEHFVASPNAERAWCYQRLADIGDTFGDVRTQDWREKADAIITAVRTELWSEQAGFFKCVYPDGTEETVLSIQGFDAMRAGACTEHMVDAMFKHVREGAFLGEYGVSSVSAEDELHYELNDPDWSGGGSYTGDGPLLALTLWEQCRPELAWDVLQRLFWMGKHLLYYPQEHYCDRPAVAEHKRSNIVSGLSGAQAILFGLVGLELSLDGTITVQPGWPTSLQGTIELSGVTFREQRIDITIVNGHATIKPAASNPVPVHDQEAMVN